MAFPSKAVQLGITARVNPAEAVLDVLEALAAEGVEEIPIVKLAAAVDYSPRTVSRALDSLEGRGLITRERSGWRRTYCYKSVRRG